MSDYEFFVQFNNFDTNFPFASNTKNITPATNLSDPPLFQCKWDSCINQVSDDTFMKHLLLSHIDKNENKFHCEWNNCNFELDNLDSLLEHVNSHKQDVPFPMMESIPTPVSFYEQSPVINTPSSSSVAGVNITSMKISPREPQYCPTTDESFTCKWQIGTNPSGEPITCDKTHSLAGELQDHIIDHIGLGKSVYNCEWVGCSRHNGKEFVQKQKLLRHIHIHTGHKPCKCHVCGACFAVDAMLRQHLRIHTGEKPFQCNICGKTFTTSSSLSIHNRVHTGEKPLECKWPGCGKRFSESSNYTKHLKVHMKSYHCEVCGEAFDKKPDYTKHLKLHKK